MTSGRDLDILRRACARRIVNAAWVDDPPIEVVAASRCRRRGDGWSLPGKESLR